MQNLLNFSSYRGISLLENGKFIDLHFAKAIAGRRHSHLLENVIELSISPRHAAQLSLLNDKTLKDLENEYQPRLLMYRLENFPSVLSSTADDMIDLTLPLLAVARNLGHCCGNGTTLYPQQSVKGPGRGSSRGAPGGA